MKHNITPWRNKKTVYSSGGHRGKKTRLVSRRRVSFKYLLKRGDKYECDPSS